MSHHAPKGQILYWFPLVLPADPKSCPLHSIMKDYFKTNDIPFSHTST